jgi:ABC-type amino acid transport system permease subunit
MYVLVGFIYILMVTIATWLVRNIERKLHTPGLEVEVERH